MQVTGQDHVHAAPCNAGQRHLGSAYQIVLLQMFGEVKWMVGHQNLHPVLEGMKAFFDPQDLRSVDAPSLNTRARAVLTPRIAISASE